MTLCNKLLMTVSLLLLNACAPTGYYKTVDKYSHISPNIIYAPAIDVPYTEAEDARNNNNDLTVRWGGEVVKSSKVDESTTRLTIAAMPLTIFGRPIDEKLKDQQTNYFVVDVIDEFIPNIHINGHLITFYGHVTANKDILINEQTLSVPSLKLIDVVNWKWVDNNEIAYQRRAYHNSFVKYGHFGHGFGFGHSSGGFGGSSFGGRHH